MPPALAIGGAAVAGGILGGISGAQGQQSNQNQTNTSSDTSGVNLSQASGLETQSLGATQGALTDLQGMVSAGPGQSDVTNAYQNNLSLANMLQQYSQGGYLPNQQQIATANSITSNLFAPQQTALNQAFLTQTQQAANQAAIQGRSVSDPVLQAQLRVGQIQQQQLLNSQQGAYAQNMALQMPLQNLDYAQQQNQLLNGLASQAMSNRQMIAGLGSSITNNERNWRLSTAQKYNNSNSTGNMQGQQGGGLAGAINGVLGGVGGGLKLGSMLGGFGGGSVGAASPGLGGQTMASYQALPQMSYPSNSMSAYQALP